MSKKTKAAPKPVEHKFLIGELMEHCEELTGRKKEVAVGALFDCKEDRLTKKEFIEKVNTFLKKKVNNSLKKEVK